jgi:hypothetical protein
MNGKQASRAPCDNGTMADGGCRFGESQNDQFEVLTKHSELQPMTNDDDACVLVMQTPHAKQLLILTSPHFHLSAVVTV